MPIRIKPSLILSPCILTLESIQKITELISNEFPNTSDIVNFSASDDVWEIYDEPCTSFLKAITERSKLDSFKVEVKSVGSIHNLLLLFNEKEANVSLEADSQQEHWFQHFLIDLKKCILPPTFTQLAVHVYGQQNFSFGIRLAFFIIPVNPSLKISTPYTKIVIHQKPPNPFLENIKANIVSNIIWAVLVFALGAAFTLITQQILGR